jgi:hypothetical protein
MKNPTMKMISLVVLAGVSLAGGTFTNAIAGPKAVGELCLNPNGICPKPLGPFVGIPMNPLAPNPPAPQPPANPGMNGFGAGFVGGLVAGTIINGMNQPQQTIVVQQPQYVQPVQQPQYVQSNGNMQAHISDCQRRYKTYDIATNSFMSNAGYRKPCNSPFL